MNEHPVLGRYAQCSSEKPLAVVSSFIFPFARRERSTLFVSQTAVLPSLPANLLAFRNKLFTINGTGPIDDDTTTGNTVSQPQAGH